MSWQSIIDKHRRNARDISFRILVWGSSDQDAKSHTLRLSVRKHLCNTGYSAKFSEDLLCEGKEAAAPDIIMDEIFHADAANLIVVLYGSRGTQTEVDVILEFDEFARKSVILLDDEIWSNLKHSLSCFRWQSLGARILIVSKQNWNEEVICKNLDEIIEEFQFSEYIRKLKLGELKK